MRALLGGLVLLLGLAGCAGRADPAQEAADQAQAVADKAGAACLARFEAGGMSNLQYWRCGDAALLALGKSINGRNLDIYEDTAARNEAIAADLDAGRITHDEALWQLHLTALEMQSRLVKRGTVPDSVRAQVTCSSAGDTTTCVQRANAGTPPAAATVARAP